LDGTSVGIDFSEDRIQHATNRYSDARISFQCRNILDPLDDLGEFDFVIMRFILEYFRSKAFDIVKNVARIVKHGGILCLIDLDHNCLNHYGLPARLQRAITTIMDKLSSDADFDPHMGIKLYAMLYDLCFDSIDVTMSAHHMIFGELDPVQEYNWTRKIEVAAKHCGCDFEEYEDGYDAFYAEFNSSFAAPRLFLYTPIICCRGVRSM
jgi:SAM-dependent methyltransferase